MEKTCECEGVEEAAESTYKKMIDAGAPKYLAEDAAHEILNGDWVKCECGAGNEIIFEWEVPEDYPRFTSIDSVAEAYRVVENEKASGGIIMHEKYNGKWSIYNQSCRPLIRHLVSLIKGKDESKRPD